MYKTSILADSISDSGVRLTTFQLTFPRFVLAEFNTHRMFSRNSASSRAIPVEKMLRQVKEDPFIPIHWGKKQKGMQADEEISPEEQIRAEDQWRGAAFWAELMASRLLDIGVHKQITNRLLEPFLWHTVICTATDWENAINLRAHPAAQPEIRPVFESIREQLATHEPEYVKPGRWHMPLMADLPDLIAAGYTLPRLLLISIGRCARISYMTHDGKRDPLEDIRLAQRLHKDGHMSPFEHVAVATNSQKYFGNFKSWCQYRKLIKGEAVYRP